MNFKEKTIIKNASRFIDYDVKAFLEGKKLIVNKIMNEQPLQLAVGIDEDNTTYKKKNISNEGQEFLVKLTEESTREEIGELLKSGMGTVEIETKGAQLTVIWGVVTIHTSKITFVGFNGEEEVYEVEGVFESE